MISCATAADRVPTRFIRLAVASLACQRCALCVAAEFRNSDRASPISRDGVDEYSVVSSSF